MVRRVAPDRRPLGMRGEGTRRLVSFPHSFSSNARQAAAIIGMRHKVVHDYMGIAVKDKGTRDGPSRVSEENPQFADLSPADEARTRDLIRSGHPGRAIDALVLATGCPLGWAKEWVIHEGRPRPETPCPRCGKPLRTEHARQCPHGKADWH